MVEYKIYYSFESIIDLESIYNYISSDQSNYSVALKIINELKESVNSLNYLPLRHGRVLWSPWKDIGVRAFALKQYVIFYLVDETKKIVNIVRILSCRRDIPSEIKMMVEK